MNKKKIQTRSYVLSIVFAAILAIAMSLLFINNANAGERFQDANNNNNALTEKNDESITISFSTRPEGTGSFLIDQSYVSDSVEVPKGAYSINADPTDPSSETICVKTENGYEVIHTIGFIPDGARFDHWDASTAEKELTEDTTFYAHTSGDPVNLSFYSYPQKYMMNFLLDGEEIDESCQVPFGTVMHNTSPFDPSIGLYSVDEVGKETQIHTIECVPTKGVYAGYKFAQWEKSWDGKVLTDDEDEILAEYDVYHRIRFLKWSDPSDASGEFIDQDTGQPISKTFVADQAKYLLIKEMDPSSPTFQIADDKQGTNAKTIKFVPDKEDVVFLGFSVSGYDPNFKINDWVDVTAHLDKMEDAKFLVGYKEDIDAGAKFTKVGGGWNLSDDETYVTKSLRRGLSIDGKLDDFRKYCNLEFKGHEIFAWNFGFDAFKPTWRQSFSRVILEGDDPDAHKSFVGVKTVDASEYPFEFTSLDASIPVGTKFKLDEDGITIHASYDLGVRKEVNWSCYFRAVAKDGYVFDHYLINDKVLQPGEEGEIEIGNLYSTKAIYKKPSPGPDPTPTPTPDPRPGSGDGAASVGQHGGSPQTSDLAMGLIGGLAMIALASTAVVVYRKKKNQN